MDYLSKLCHELKIDPTELKIMENGTSLLSLNDRLAIHIKFLEPGLYLHAVITSCPKEKQEPLFMKLMKANFLGQGTLGAAIGLSADEKNLTLSLVFPYELNYRTFRGTVEDFTNIVDYWRIELT
jgi:hypothetical protein